MISGLLRGALVELLLPEWEPHGRPRLRELFDLELVHGPVDVLAMAGGFTSIAFVSFTSSVPLWLVREHRLANDDPLIGWTLGAFSLAAGLGALLGGFLAPRLGRRTVIVGSLLGTVLLDHLVRRRIELHGTSRKSRSSPSSLTHHPGCTSSTVAPPPGGRRAGVDGSDVPT